MPRVLHGSVLSLNTLQVAAPILAAADAEAAAALDPILKGRLRSFGYMFPELQDDAANLLPVAADTPAKLVALGRTMAEPNIDVIPDDAGDTGGQGRSGIPAAYTYFGQFVDHDITLEAASDELMPNLLDPNLQPLPRATILESLRNTRTATLDLDSVYRGESVRTGDKMSIGLVTKLNGTQPPTLRPPGKDDANDLPRRQRNPGSPAEDRAALIGDPRNDENLIIAQLHVAFLRAHNALVDQGLERGRAMRTLRQHYQHLVLHDFLRRIADPAVVDRILQAGNRVYDPADDQFFLPLEYTVAAYRFGHSMVRNVYDYNLNFNTSGDPDTIPASLALLFLFTALSGQLDPLPRPVPPGGGSETLPDNWIIEWERFVEAGGGVVPNLARRIDTKLVEPGLNELRDLDGSVLAPDNQARLAVRNLLRGYLLRMPTGQAVARRLGLTPLLGSEVEAAAASPEQVAALQVGGFSDRTPLWYYVLAEAAHPNHGDGQRLGPVGSTIVAEVLIGLVRRSRNSILTDPDWNGPTIGPRPGTFELVDLLRLAGVLA